MEKSAFSVLGIWQVLNIVLYLGIDASWNKVQRWPVLDWFNIQSVAFPFVLSLTIALVFFIIAGLIAMVTD